MAKPSEKSPEMESALDDITKRVFGRSRTGSITTNVCVTCGKPAESFKDELSKKEYAISGMCQDCQDSVFGYFSTEGE